LYAGSPEIFIFDATISLKNSYVSNRKYIFMKRYLLLIIVLLTFLNSSRAAYFEFLPYTITQPDGTKISCFVSGDEFFNWIHDQDGYTIIQSSDGFFYYAEQSGDQVKPSKYLVNSVIPGNVGLTKWIKISLAEYQKKHDASFAYRKGAKGIPENAPQTGTLNNIVIYLRFADDVEFTTTRQTYDDKFNPTTGSTLKSYYLEVSYNKLTINSTHYPACAMTTNLSYQDSHTRSYFQIYDKTTNPTGYSTDSERTTREHTLLVNAVTWINTYSPVPTSINIDGDGDNYVDNVCFIVRGSYEGWNELLWAHRWALYSQTVNINGKRVYDYTFQPESQVAVTTICHEMFHSLGAPDLYHYTNQGVIAPCGRWDIMDGGSGHMLSYMKWKYAGKKWISSIPSITSAGTYTLNPVTSASNNCYKIASPNTKRQYFVVEYRKISGIFEANLPGSGLIVYRVDTAYNGNSNGPPDEIYVYRPGGTTSANGTPNSAYFSSTAGRTVINDATNPSSFLQDGSAGGLQISNVTSAGTTISFDVGFPPPPSAPVSLSATNIFQTTFTARWNSSSTATGYKLDVAIDPGFTSFVTGYNDKDVSSLTSYSVSGLSAKTNYYYRVRAYNFGGTGLNSSVITLKTLTNPSSVPTGLTAGSCNDLVTLRWKRSVGADFAKYMIYYSTNGSSVIKLDSVMNNIADTSKVISGLTRGKSYYFQVSAINTDGPESSYSDQMMTIVKTGVIPRIKSKFGQDVLVCYNLNDSIRSYQWYKDGTIVTGQTLQYLQTGKKTGKYKVQTIDLNTCKNTSSEYNLTAIKGAYSVYPNPAVSSFSLKISDESLGHTVISVLDFDGKKLLEFPTEKTDSELIREIPVSSLKRGIYIVRVSINDELIFTTNLVVIN
jgi:M6 family metalloprotease-like protein